jgi:predicted nucleic acid-binding protein
VLLDTNILVRHLTGEPAEQARRATMFLRNADALELPVLIVAELVYVLESVYEQTRPQVAALVRAVLAHPPVQASEGTVLLRAVELAPRLKDELGQAWLDASFTRNPERGMETEVVPIVTAGDRGASPWTEHLAQFRTRKR